MQQQIDAIEATSDLAGYRSAISHRSKVDFDHEQSGTHGVLMGYDFHLTTDGPRLIEVNTNAGGAFIMQSMLATVWHNVSPCNAETLDAPSTIERSIVEMFIDEWQFAGRTGKPSTVAIVDSDPQNAIPLSRHAAGHGHARKKRDYYCDHYTRVTGVARWPFVS